MYYEDQKPEALRRADDFKKLRLPKFLGYFERMLGENPAGDRHLVGKSLSYPDLSMFHDGAPRLPARCFRAPAGRFYFAMLLLRACAPFRHR